MKLHLLGPRGGGKGLEVLSLGFFCLDPPESNLERPPWPRLRALTIGRKKCQSVANLLDLTLRMAPHFLNSLYTLHIQCSNADIPNLNQVLRLNCKNLTKLFCCVGFNDGIAQGQALDLSDSSLDEMQDWFENINRMQSSHHDRRLL
ncbi:hypothetical protein CC2G_003040 [Coprinopsis cinerea AmutBmut pab1-1]|nr:hypothetical protein CC2G_003040 [Coprinopsis cinerea AmutBmut pab1-1]